MHFLTGLMLRCKSNHLSFSWYLHFVLIPGNSRAQYTRVRFHRHPEYSSLYRTYFTDYFTRVIDAHELIWSVFISASWSVQNGTPCLHAFHSFVPCCHEQRPMCMKRKSLSPPSASSSCLSVTSGSDSLFTSSAVYYSVRTVWITRAAPSCSPW